MSVPNIIGLTGYAGSGKDAAAKTLLDRGFVRVSFADNVREALLRLDPFIPVGESDFEFDGGGRRGTMQLVTRRLSEILEDMDYQVAKESYPEIRRLLQRLGTDVVRQMFGDDVWVKAGFAQMEPDWFYVITDVRFPNEGEAIRDAGGEVWRIIRPGVGPLNDHPSETLVDSVTVDRIIHNDGSLEDLEERVLELIPWLSVG